jgi:hypothetical protein
MFHSAKGISPASGCQFGKQRVMLQFGDEFGVGRVKGRGTQENHRWTQMDADFERG